MQQPDIRLADQSHKHKVAAGRADVQASNVVTRAKFVKLGSPERAVATRTGPFSCLQSVETVTGAVHFPKEVLHQLLKSPNQQVRTRDHQTQQQPRQHQQMVVTVLLHGPSVYRSHHAVRYVMI